MPPPPITPQSLLGMVNQIIDDENERMLQEALLNLYPINNILNTIYI